MGIHILLQGGLRWLHELFCKLRTVYNEGAALRGSEEQRRNPCLLSDRQTAVGVWEVKEWWGGRPRDDRFGGHAKNPEVPGGNS